MSLIIVTSLHQAQPTWVIVTSLIIPSEFSQLRNLFIFYKKNKFQKKSFIIVHIIFEIFKLKILKMLTGIDILGSQ